MITNGPEQKNPKMTSKEALENIKDMVEYITRLDYVEPIVRGEVKDALYKAYHKSTPEFEIIEKGLDKLNKIEKIEQTIGIGLVTLFKALKNGIYDINGNHYLDITLDLEDSCLSRMHDDGNDVEFHDFWFKDYGVKWALTREELEK